MTEQEIIKEACEATCDSIMDALHDETQTMPFGWKNKKMQAIVELFYELREAKAKLEHELETLKILHEESKL